MNSKLKAGIILAVVFAIGILAGTSVDRLLSPFRMEKSGVEHIQQRMTERLGLTEDQVVKVREILEDSQLKYDAFFKETRPTFERIRREQRQRIRTILTSEQIETFDKWLDERRNRRGGRDGERRGSSGHGPPRPGGPPPPDTPVPAEN